MRRALPDRGPRPGRRPPAPVEPKRRRLGGRLLAAVPTLLLLLLVGWVVLFALNAPKLPDTAALFASADEPRVTVLAADGTLIAERSEGGRSFVRLSEISPDLIDAVVATEDQRFWSHFGLDPLGIARAAVANFRSGGVVQGGSTITQQLAKILFLTPERSLKRKLEEMTLALWLEARLSKEEILTLYLNRVYLGAGTYGVAAAARRYFAKPALELSLPEAAMIGGLLKAPSALAPTNDIERARDRASIVLRRMVDEGYITEDQATTARSRPAKLAADGPEAYAGHFIDWVMDGVIASLGQPQRDVVVRTTLDPRLQRHTAQSVAALLREHGAKQRVDSAAVVLLDDSGAVRAMVGGESYRSSRLNRAVAARRQPGSVFKPFVVLAALERGYRADSVIADRPITIGRWSPENFDRRYRGDVTLETVLADSLNTPAVRLVQDLGPAAVAQTGYRLGIASDLQAVPSLALGTSEVTLLEITGAYLPFAIGGFHRPLFAVAEVRDRRGRVLYEHRDRPSRVVESGVANEMARMLRVAAEAGTGKAARIEGRPVAGKTGTTQNNRDAWFVGFSGAYVLGVWLGNDDGRPMQGVTGSGLPARLWKEIMRETPAPAPQSVVAIRRPEPPQPRPDSQQPRNIPEELARKGANWLIRMVEDAWATARQ
jgi:penicillin-binding protein 1A